MKLPKLKWPRFRPPEPAHDLKEGDWIFSDRDWRYRLYRLTYLSLISPSSCVAVSALKGTEHVLDVTRCRRATEAEVAQHIAARLRGEDPGLSELMKMYDQWSAEMARAFGVWSISSTRTKVKK